jgi:hypothetical protein
LVTVDIDATIVTACSDTGNAGSNTAADHIEAARLVCVPTIPSTTLTSRVALPVSCQRPSACGSGPLSVKVSVGE